MMKIEGKNKPPEQVLPDSTSDVFEAPLVDSDDSSDDEPETVSLKVGSDDVKNQIVTNPQNHNVVNQIDVLQHVFNAASSSQTLGNVFIERSNGVHIGNITYVTGPIHINQASSGEATVNSSQTSNKPPDKEQSTNDRSSKAEDSSDEEVEREEVNQSDAFIGNIRRAINGNVLKMVNRITWLAQKPLEPYEYLDGPAQYVIISHTATEEGLTQADNVYLVRNIQCFHIESRRWDDIAYNFLIGCDGNVYEGRGWGTVGAHTYGYNKKSVGISFIGCFMRETPPDISIKACKLLIKRGIELKHIRPDYILLAHCQCSPTESPGKKLLEEIQTWSHFCPNPTVCDFPKIDI